MASSSNCWSRAPATTIAARRAARRPRPVAPPVLSKLVDTVRGNEHARQAPPRPHRRPISARSTLSPDHRRNPPGAGSLGRRRRLNCETPDPREGVDKLWQGDLAIYSHRLSAQRTKSRLSRIMSSPLYKQMTIRSWDTTARLLSHAWTITEWLACSNCQATHSTRARSVPVWR
jgi:hypothetical protein